MHYMDGLSYKWFNDICYNTVIPCRFISWFFFFCFFNLFIAYSISSLRTYGSCVLFEDVLYLCSDVNSLQYSCHLLIIPRSSVMSSVWSFIDINRFSFKQIFCLVALEMTFNFIGYLRVYEIVFVFLKSDIQYYFRKFIIFCSFVTLLYTSCIYLLSLFDYCQCLLSYSWFFRFIDSFMCFSLF